MDDTLSSLRQAHGFDEWYGRNTLSESLFIQGFVPAEGLLPGWRLVRSTPLRVPGSPPCVQTVWMAEDGDESALLRMDVYECDSRPAAHEMAMGMVAQFQAAGVSRRDDLAVGDVNFVPMGQHGVVFSRGNLLFFIGQAGRVPVDAVGLARLLDQELSAHPGEGAMDAAAAASAADFAVESLEPPPVMLRQTSSAGKATLDMESPADARAAGGASYTKVFSRTGEISAERGRLVYEPTEPGQPEVEVFDVDVRGNAIRRSVRPDRD